MTLIFLVLFFSVMLNDFLMKTRHVIKTVIKQRVKTCFLSTLIALNIKWVPHLNVIVTSQALIKCLISRYS